ncbi:putative DJ-1/PfpI family protein [Blattamonas nauphoetae]|uniref:DJ-1/PfpI family protein n=1 Tax=Blattamonas nauphoetae TaxID=2049346 RepID=A0ABQ9XE84_9EUKA|nr:putative DJ-1/PfpI family protein [Blattamonas nauphoetae]
MVKVLVPLYTAFEELEALSIVDLLRRAGVIVTTASITGQKLVTAGQGVNIEADTLFSDVQNEPFDCIAVPGGMGHPALGTCEPLLNLLRTYVKDQSKTVAAICAAPFYLGEAGVLDGKKATCYPALLPKLKCAERKEDPLVIDGNVITSRGPGTSFMFALALVEKLCGKAKRDEIVKQTVFSE